MTMSATKANTWSVNKDQRYSFSTTGQTWIGMPFLGTGMQISLTVSGLVISVKMMGKLDEITLGNKNYLGGNGYYYGYREFPNSINILFGIRYGSSSSFECHE